MSKVVPLPTAARRKVQQPCSRAGRAVRNALRAAQPWPGEYMSPGQRRALETAKTIAKVEPSPALTIALALVALLDEDTRLRVIGEIAKGGSGTAREALALLQVQKLTIGERVDLDWALERLRASAANV